MKKFKFLDTSVLVPVFYGEHEHHEASLDLYSQLSKADAGCGAHTLVEVYSSLTRMPGRHRVSADQALLFVDDIVERLTVVALTLEEHISTLRSFGALGIVGGTIYDAMLAGCALKADAETIFTWNLRHYGQFGPEVTRRLRKPGAGNH
jgi:predicted nucleic acid-binding protein